MAPVAQIEKRTRFDEIEYPESDGEPMAETAIHQELMIYNIVALRHYYADNPMVHVAGNNFLYYEEGNIKKNVSPDIYVVFGVRHWLRPIYKLWEEGGITPRVVIELTAKKTKNNDMFDKLLLYRDILKVHEYIQFDPTGDYLHPRLQGYRLERGVYTRIPMENGDRIFSQNLGLYLVIQEEYYRFLNPRTDRLLKSPDEIREQNGQLTEQNEWLIEQQHETQRLLLVEAERARNAEDDLAQLRAEFEKMKQQNAAE